MTRSLKIFWVLLATLGLMGLMGSNSVLMASHITHFASLKGPGLPQDESGCLTCHAPGHLQCGEEAPLFNDDPPQPLATTHVCDPCHSPDGTYDGVNDPVIGAKANWESGVYDSEFEVLPYWQPSTEYEAGDIVLYKPYGVTNVYVAKHDCTSGTTIPIADNWTWIDYWQRNTQYYVGDLVRHNGKVYRSRLNFKTGSSSQPNANYWELVERTGAGEERLIIGKEKWCAGCHDEVPAYSKADYAEPGGVHAPKVLGDNSNYGFYVSGHGREGIDKQCLDCHNSTFAHIDHEHRTYEVHEEQPYGVMHTYKDSYRLKSNMAIPDTPSHRRPYPPEDPPEDRVDIGFKLCIDVCHDAHPDVFSGYSCSEPEQYLDPKYYNTNFRDHMLGQQYHDCHMATTTFGASSDCWDSDWDGDGDSMPSCPTCHNVHGSPMEVNGVLKPNPVMIRHGELISTPETTDKVPAFDFHWSKYPEAPGPLIETNVLLESIMGYMLGPNLEDNRVCQTCHGGRTIPCSYPRTPGGTPKIIEMNMWVTDLNNNPKEGNVFSPGEAIHYHLSFFVTGHIDGTQYWVQTLESGAYNNDSIPGTNWQTPIEYGASLPRGSHNECFERTIPSYATPGSMAKYRIDLRMAYSEEDANNGQEIPDSRVLEMPQVIDIYISE